MVNIVKKIVPESRYYLKCPYEMTPTRIVVHNTANDAPARNEISYMTNNDYETSFHYAVDDKEIVQGLPENRNGWHASDGNGKGNREGIAIEICYSLSGGDRFIKAEQNAVDLIVDILNRYNWDIDKVTKHQDYTNKYCPHRTLDMGWDRFLNMINEKLSETRARPFIVGTKIYNTEDIYLTETAGYGGGQMLLTKNTESIVKKYHYNKGLYMALGTENTYYDAAWTNNYSKFTTTKPPVEEQKEDNINNKGELVWDSFKETCEAKSVPENMLAQSKTDVNLMYTNFAEMSGMTLDELLESFGMDEDGVSEIAEDSVIDVMIAKSIMAKENLTMDDTTYKNKLWTALGYEDGDDEKSLSDLEKEYKESQGSHPKNDMMIEVAKDYIGDQAKVSDGETTNE